MESKGEARHTELEDRLAVMRQLMGALVAHLEDNGLIDRDLLEQDLWKTVRVARLHEEAEEDLRRVFQVADAHIDIWQGQRDADLPPP